MVDRIRKKTLIRNELATRKQSKFINGRQGRALETNLTPE